MTVGPGELIRIEERYYILASSSRVDDRTRVLKHAETFAVLDRFGDMAPVGIGELGLYHRDTRFLSRLGLTLNHERPLLLSSTVNQENTLLAVDLTNPDLPVGDALVIRRGTLHLARETQLWEGVLYERLRVVNYGAEPAAASLELSFDADYADLFEVRGARRPKRGAMLPVRAHERGLSFSYRGLDGVTRCTRIRCTPRPASVADSGLRIDIALQPHEEAVFMITIACACGDDGPELIEFGEVRQRSARALDAVRRGEAQIATSNAHFDEWLGRSLSDLHLMLTPNEHGLYPYAGVPWYSTVFGRDGIITALETLWLNPDVARGVLRYLAATQASELDEEKDAQPGKILHECRLGEMAALREVPFGRYYGSVDATPLFVMLAAAYHQRVHDPELLAETWPAVERALDWMDRWGDVDGDGLIEYQRQSPRGLVHQGWKDSHDSVFHADGSPAQAPIALCEVQGYAYAARRGAARLAWSLGHVTRATEWREQARRLRRTFERLFWCDDLGTYALALDGAKRPCRVRTSNPGHLLFTRVAAPGRARRVMETLLAPSSFSGWGVRTVAENETRYNPMSYHNGSVWPHDTALVAAGLARYGLRDAALTLMGGLFEASLFVELHRLPELFCGFERRPGEGPTLYPVACSPQSWASGAPFLMLQANLGLAISARERRVSFERPVMPRSVREIHVNGLRVGEERVDLAVVRHAHDVGVHVLGRTGKVEVRVVS